jgi:hypothetical protein
MQGVPPTKITVKNYTPLHPTSAYKIATTFLPTATVQLTQTQSQTFSVKSMENTVGRTTTWRINNSNLTMCIGRSASGSFR